MLDNRKLVLDTFSEVYQLLQPWTDAEFWDFEQHQLIPNAVYLFGRQQFITHKAQIRHLVESNQILAVLSNPHEGSDTLRKQTIMHGFEDLFHAKRMLLIGGGDMDPAWPCLRYDSFLPKLLDYEHNIAAQARTNEIYQHVHKPYKFLFLNGRGRPHRRWLIQRWLASDLLSQSLWSNLDSPSGPVQVLPKQYEVDRYQHTSTTAQGYVKFQLFNDEWGEIYLNPEAYIDTYFSVVTETVHDYPYSFRTEKIWKPIVMGHPWIAVANQGFLRDMHHLGFRTFGHLIDETFDSIENNQDRLLRVATVVEDLCRQDLAAFLAEAQQTCKYNQQHYAVMREQVRAEFPQRFKEFVQSHE